MPEPILQFAPIRRPLTLLAAVLGTVLMATAPVGSIAQGASGLRQPQPDQGIPLPADPDIVQGQLSNGLRFAIVPVAQDAAQPAALAIVLQIRVGTAFERAGQIGAAQISAELASVGALTASDDQFGRVLESFGLDPERAVRSMSSFDTTRWTLSVPLSEDHALSSSDLARLMDIFASMLKTAELQLDHETVERGKRRVLSSQAAWSGASQRITARAMPDLFANENFAHRVPIYNHNDLTLQAESVEQFVAEWYSPQRAVLVVSGPVDPALTRRAIGRAFGPIDAGKMPDEPDLRVVRRPHGVALAESDPGVGGDTVQLILIDPPAAPLDTHLALRDRLSELVAVEALNRRLSALAQRGDSAALRAGAFTNAQASAFRTSMLSVSGPAGSWSDLTGEAVACLQSVIRDGLLPEEFNDARASVLTALDTQAAAAVRATPASRAMTLAGQLHRGDALSSNEQIRRIASTVMPHITPEQVRQSLEYLFDVQAMSTLVVTAVERPTEPEILQRVGAARDMPSVHSKSAAHTLTRLPILDTPPATPPAGSVLELTHDPVLDINHALLSSGVRVQHRYMVERPGRIEIALSMLGGVIEQNTEQAALTDALRSIAMQPATANRSSQQIVAAIAGHNLNLSARVDGEALTLQITTSPEDFQLAMQMLHALITQPVIEEGAIERWRADALSISAQTRFEPVWAAYRVYQDSMHPTLAHRGNIPTEEQVNSITQHRANEWLKRIINQSPITLAIVGDIDRAEALHSAAMYFGSIPSRPAPTAERFAAARTIAIPGAEVNAELHIPLATDQAAVVLGFRGADRADIIDSRTLAMLAAILESRLQHAAEHQLAITGAIRVFSVDAEVFRGSGRFWIRALVPPDHADAVLELFKRELQQLAERGPTTDELDRARRLQADSIRQTAGSPRSWALALARDAGLGGEPLRVLATPPPSPTDLSPDQAAAVLRRYTSCTTRTFSIVVTPTAP